MSSISDAVSRLRDKVDSPDSQEVYEQTCFDLRAVLDELERLQKAHEQLKEGHKEVSRRYNNARKLVARSVKVIDRPAWKQGETDDEYRAAANTWLGLAKMEDKYQKESKS